MPLKLSSDELSMLPPGMEGHLSRRPATVNPAQGGGWKIEENVFPLQMQICAQPESEKPAVLRQA